MNDKNAERRQTYHNRRQRAINMYGGKCSCCGDRQYEFLIFDHEKGGGGAQRKSLAPLQFLAWLLESRRPEIRILCANCHAAIHATGKCPHRLEFDEGVVASVSKGLRKGYDDALWLVTHRMPHPLGEIVFKAVRYSRQGNPEDLVKIAAWAKVVWEGECVNGKGSGAGDRKGSPFTWPLDQGYVTGSFDTGPRVFGSDTGGPRRAERAEAIFSAFNKDVHVKGRTGASGGHRRTVGGKHRHAARKRKS